MTGQELSAEIGYPRTTAACRSLTATTHPNLVSFASSTPTSNAHDISLANNTTNTSGGSLDANSLSDAAFQESVDDGIEAPIATTSEDLVVSLKADTCTSASQMSHASSAPNDTEIIVAGSLAIDLSCDYIPSEGYPNQGTPQHSTSNRAAITQSVGGVAQNIATTIHYLGSSVRLCSLVGDDSAGSAATAELKKRGLKTVGIIEREGYHTARYIAFNDSRKDLVLAMADMAIFERSSLDGKEERGIRRTEVRSQWQAHVDVCKPKWVVIDANWEIPALRSWIGTARFTGAKIAFEPVSAAKSERIFQIFRLTKPNNRFMVDLATPNVVELSAMHAAAKKRGYFGSSWRNMIDAMDIPKDSLADGRTIHRAIELLPCIPTILTKLGDQGVLMTQLLRPGDDRLTSKSSEPYILHRPGERNDLVGGIYVRLFPPVEKVPESEIISVNGVGDTFLGVLVAGLTQENPKRLEDLIDIAQRGSVMTLKSKESVSPQVATLRSEL